MQSRSTFKFPNFSAQYFKYLIKVVKVKKYTNKLALIKIRQDKFQTQVTFYMESKFVFM